MTVEEQLPKRDWDPADPPRLCEALGVIAMLVLGGVCCTILYGSMIAAMVKQLLKD